MSEKLNYLLMDAKSVDVLVVILKIKNMAPEIKVTKKTETDEQDQTVMIEEKIKGNADLVRETEKHKNQSLPNLLTLQL